MSDQSGQRKSPNRRNNGRRFNKNKNQGGKNRRPKTLSPLRVLQKYDNLLDQHLVARKKYFELYGRSNDKQLDKAEQNFYQTLRDLRSFEEKLTDWQKEALEGKTEMYPKDTLISKTYNEEVIEVSFEGDFEDPHLLPMQRQADFSSDTEESVGTYEDYKNYKGIQE